MPKRQILIVDDEAPIRELLLDTLQAAGYQCLCAENSQQAYALELDHRPEKRQSMSAHYLTALSPMPAYWPKVARYVSILKPTPVCR